MDFKPGDRVSLINSGLPMAVEVVRGDDVMVVRHDPKGRTIRETYKAAVLRKFEPPKPIRFVF